MTEGLELFRVLVGETPGDIGGVARVVNLLGAGGDAVAQVVLLMKMSS